MKKGKVTNILHAHEVLLKEIPDILPQRAFVR